VTGVAASALRAGEMGMMEACMTWLCRSVAAAIVIAAFAPAAAHAQFNPRDVAGPPAREAAPPRAPVSPVRPRPTEARYQVIPHSIYARDETGWDRAGSDEIFAVFRDPVSGVAVKTATFGGVDTGRTRYFGQANGCVTPIGPTFAGEDGTPAAWACREGGVATVAFSVELYEDDDDGPTGQRPSYYSDHCGAEDAPANCWDDRIGRADVAFSAQQLREMMPSAGQMRETTVRLGGYDFTYRIFRLNDVVLDPPREIIR
jgi:hypothetical protein